MIRTLPVFNRPPARYKSLRSKQEERPERQWSTDPAEKMRQEKYRGLAYQAVEKAVRSIDAIENNASMPRYNKEKALSLIIEDALPVIRDFLDSNIPIAPGNERYLLGLQRRLSLKQIILQVKEASAFMEKNVIACDTEEARNLSDIIRQMLNNINAVLQGQTPLEQKELRILQNIKLKCNQMSLELQMHNSANPPAEE